MERLDQNLISYKELLEFLKKKGKSIAWFNNIRCRCRFNPRPIHTPPVSFKVKGRGITLRQGKATFYLKGMLPIIEKVIDLHDNHGLPYKKIKEKIQKDVEKLKRLRNVELFDDKRVKPWGFLEGFKVSIVKLDEYFQWKKSSVDENNSDRTMLIY